MCAFDPLDLVDVVRFLTPSNKSVMCETTQLQASVISRLRFVTEKLTLAVNSLVHGQGVTRQMLWCKFEVVRRQTPSL